MNKNKNLIYTVLGVLMFIGLLFLVTVFFRNSSNEIEINNESKIGEVISFTVDRPNFVIVGKNLNSVKIFGIPTGTNIPESAHTFIASAKNSGSDNGTQRWTALIPSDPILLSQIYAVATDINGQTLDRFYFSLNGATEIYNSLWQDTPSEIINLNVGEERDVYGLLIELVSVSNDSRCPVNVNCVTAGSVDVNLMVSSNTESRELELNSNTKNNDSAYGYNIKIEEVKPLPIADESIDEAEYEVTLLISQEFKS